jgi:hypothetical protein
VERIYDIAILLLLFTSSGLLIFKKIPLQISEAMGIGYFLLLIVIMGLIGA